jgi:hypothetical protein
VTEGGWRARNDAANVDEDGTERRSEEQRASESAWEDQRSGVCTKLAAERD